MIGASSLGITTEDDGVTGRKHASGSDMPAIGNGVSLPNHVTKEEISWERAKSSTVRISAGACCWLSDRLVIAILAGLGSCPGHARRHQPKQRRYPARQTLTSKFAARMFIWNGGPPAGPGFFLDIRGDRRFERGTSPLSAVQRRREREP